MFSLFKPINTFVFDVDGVLTDGSLLLLPGGEMVRKMHIKDGYALQLAVKKGYHVLIISGAHSAPVKERLEYLGIKEVHMRVLDKKALLLDFMQKHQLQKEQVLYMGDDVPDMEAMTESGLPCCPLDACTEVKEISQYVTATPGGMGCAREVIEKVMKLQHTWQHEEAVSSR